VSLNLIDRGGGPTILALHGFTGTARTWEPQLDGWASGHRVLAPDLLGHGGSAAPPDPAAYALERQADGLAELLDLLEASPACVVGYSMGARLALVLALRHQGLVDRLVLESPSAGIQDPVERQRRRAADEALADDIERDGTAAFIDRWEALPLFASHAGLPAPSRQALRRERLRHQPGGLASSLRGAGQGAMTPLQERLAELTVPTLVVAGALDEVGSARAASVAAVVPGARFVPIEDAGHTPHLEQPAAFTAATDDFIATRPAGPIHAR
jgi:2-succinyl-6-hydroxy-2,4-cyclohexadiene-1-carboxylate synthase